MKYSLEMDLNLPRNRVVELFNDPDNLKKWQPSLVSFEPISGNPGDVGSKARLRYENGGDCVEMVETIVSKKLPNELTGTYETRGVWNMVHNNFFEISPRKTRWQFDTEFKCKGFMRFLSIVVPGTFRSESLRNMQRFKDFAEQQ